MPSRNLTIVFTDIKGFTERTAAMDRDAVLKLLAKQDELLKPIIAHYGGTIIKSIGDAYLISFESPTNAVICGVVMQYTLRRYNATVWPELRIEIRVAINTGEVNLVDGDLIGDPVNLASRVEGITEANEIWFTESTYLAMNKKEVPTSIVGEFRLKGIPEAVKVYKVVQDENLELYRKLVPSQPITKAMTGSHPSVPQPPSTATRKSLLVQAMALLLVAAVGVIIVLSMPRANPELDSAKKFIDNKEYPQALFVLEKMLQKEPGNVDFQNLVRQAVDADVTGVIESKHLENAVKAIEDYGKRYPFLGRMEHLDKKLYLLKAEVEARKDLNKAGALLNEMVQKYGKDPLVVYEALKFYSKSGINVTWTFRYAHDVAKLDSKYLKDPIVIEAFLDLIAWYGPKGGWADEYEFLIAHLYDEIKPKLLEGLYTHEDADFRWNAKHVLTSKKEPVDLFKFYLVQLLDQKDSYNNDRQDETVNYFLQLVYDGPKSDVLAKVPRPITAFPLLDRKIYQPDHAVMKVVQGLFLESLRTFLTDALGYDRNECRRVNAYTLLKSKGLSPDLLMSYHSTNILQWDRGYPPWVLESLEFFERLQPPAKPGLEVVDSLKNLEEKCARAADEMRKQNYHEDANEFRRFSEAAKRALANLKREH